MKRIAPTLVVALFFVTFATGSRVSGCSCTAPPQPAANQVATVQGPRFRNEVRRESPPRMAPGDPPPKVEPMVLFDGVAGIYFYFETDGQHATAMRRDGSVIWHRDVAEHAKRNTAINRPGEKTLWVVATWAGPPADWGLKRMRELGKTNDYIGVAFNTGANGLLDKLTGEYVFLGSDYP